MRFDITNTTETIIEVEPEEIDTVDKLAKLIRALMKPKDAEKK